MKSIKQLGKISPYGCDPVGLKGAWIVRRLRIAAERGRGRVALDMPRSAEFEERETIERAANDLDDYDH